MTGSLETFELFAELALALAGFAGVASAFGGRERAFSEIEKTRLDAIFQFAGTSLAASLLLFTLIESGVAATTAYAIVCFGSGAASLAILLRQIPNVVRLYRAGQSTTSAGFIAFACAYLTALTGLYFWAAFFSPSTWPLFAGISSQLLYGLWMFARLLMRAR